MISKVIRQVWVVVVIMALSAIGIVGFETDVGSASEGEEVDLTVLLNAPQHVKPGGIYVVNLAYSNEGTLPSPEDTWVTVTLPEGVGFDNAVDRAGVNAPPDDISGKVLTWNVGVIAPDACCLHFFITLSVTEDLLEGQELEVSAEIGSSAEETISENNTASITSLVCEMAGSIKMVDFSEASPGDVLTYTIVLHLASSSNMGNEQYRMVTMTDTPPFEHQLRFLGWQGPIIGEWDGHTLRWQGLQYRMGVEGDVPHETMISNRAQLQWGENIMNLGPANTLVTLPPYAFMAGPLGYQWQHASGTTITVPPNVVQEMTRFEFKPLFEGIPPEAGPPGYSFAHQAFEMTAFQFGEIHQFNQPMTITMKMNQGEINGLNRETLRFWYRNGSGEPWAMLGEPVWLDEEAISFTTDHFTQFALFGQFQYLIHLPIIRQ
jgi:uncharacterized repeat protein (TIGR01451 family)